MSANNLLLHLATSLFNRDFETVPVETEGQNCPEVVEVPVDIELIQPGMHAPIIHSPVDPRFYNPERQLEFNALIAVRRERR